ncbi:MAG: NUDIX domain-containing protein [Chloroflexi bacterium]|nr:NUDIX domain-containing protein [Chloroflexota bacterium]
MTQFKFSVNRYGGVVIDSDSMPTQPERFAQQLADGLPAWQAEGFITVWIKIGMENADLIPIAVKHGFTFHSTHEDVLTLACKLVATAEFPDAASHYLGAGGVVINEHDELLVVRERVYSGKPGRYKLPGGYIRAGEHIADGIVREVMEETGVAATFDGLVCFRHWHVERFGKSDIYCVCRLTPQTHEITMQESEIVECLWMPVSTFVNHDDVGDFNKGVVKTAVSTQPLIHGQFGTYPNKDLLHKYELFVPSY